MHYKLNKDHIQSMLRNAGLAIIIAGILYATIENGNLQTAVLLGLTGLTLALIGSLEKRND